MYPVPIMKRAFTLLFPLLLLTACVDTEGLSPESSKEPKGNPYAAITVTEYGDLQCPACRAAHAQITIPLLEQYGDRVKFEFKHFPLRSIHRYALEAAEAAECAADQGKFWEYLDLNYENQEDMDLDAFAKWASELSLDMELFNRCIKSHIKRDTVLSDYSEGSDLGVKGTPTFFVNGKQVGGSLTAIVEAIGG